MLASHGCSVTVAERNAQVTYADPDRSYVYAIDGRGRQFTDKYGLSARLAAASVDALDVTVTRVQPDGSAVSNRQVIKDERRLVYWLPRTRCACGWPWRRAGVGGRAAAVGLLRPWLAPRLGQVAASSNAPSTRHTRPQTHPTNHSRETLTTQHTPAITRRQQTRTQLHGAAGG
jgi:hypothetical protein